MTALGLDTDRATRHVTASIAWGDGLNRLRHDHDWDLAALDLAGTGARAGEHLARATDELWLAAEFVRLVIGRTTAVDRFDGVPLDVGALLADARRRVDLASPRRERAGEAYAYREWLRTGDASDVRRRFEDRHGSDAAGVLWRLAPLEASAYWRSLTDDERDALLRAHPEIVARRVLAHAPDALTDAEIDSIEASNTFPVTTTTLEATFDLDVGVRVFEVSIGAGLSAIIRRMNGGHVEMTVLGDVVAGAGARIDVPDLASASVTAGIAREAEMRLVFTDEAGAAAALETLRRAATEDASFPELLRDLGGATWNLLVSTPNPLFGGLIPWAVRSGLVPGPPTYDLTPETVAELEEIFETNGMETTDRIGVFAEAAADVAADLHVVAAALDVSVETRLLYYETEAGPLATDVARSGVLWSGRIESDAEIVVDDALGSLDPIVGRLVPDGGVHAGADLDVMVDLAQPEHGDAFAEITLSGSAAAGSAVRLLDLEVADATLVDADVDTATVVVKVPVDASTAVDLETLAGALVLGRLPSRPLPHMSRAAEIDITTTRGSTTEGEIEVDVGAVSASASTAVSTATTTLALHRRPGGPLYARRDVDDAVARARATRSGP